MITTAQEIFDAVLEELNKEQTGTIYPAEFDLLATKAQLEWVKSKLPHVEVVQKRIDDLQTLTVVSPPLLPVATNTFNLPIILAPAIPGQFDYMQLLNCGFKITYQGNSCYTDGVESELIGSKPYKTDKAYGIDRDPFNKESDDRPYHQIIGNQIIAKIGSTGSIVSEARIEYIKYPQDIRLSANTINDIDIPLYARHELVDLIVRKKLEIIGSPRYQTFDAEKNKVPV